MLRLKNKTKERDCIGIIWEWINYTKRINDRLVN